MTLYRYGFNIAKEGIYANAEWPEIRPALEKDWSERYQDRPWKEYEEAVRDGWLMGKTPG